jgi:hypothetical protein
VRIALIDRDVPSYFQGLEHLASLARHLAKKPGPNSWPGWARSFLLRALGRGGDIRLRGGGVKGGTVYGATDEFGFKAIEKPVQVHDLHATMLHLLSLDHERLTFRHAGRDFRLTDVHGRVIRDWLA